MKSGLIQKIKWTFLFFASLVSFTATAQSYCTPTPTFGCILGDYPSQFSMTGTGLSINDPSLTCTTSGSSGFGGYQDRTTTDTANVASPSTVNCTITSNNTSTSGGYTTTSYGGTSPTSGTTESCQLWVDWNNSGVFGDGTGESIGGLAPLYNFSTPFTVSIPSGIATGYYRMRLVLSSSATYSSMDPCMQIFGIINYSTGEAIDYTIYVGPTCTAPTLTLGTATCTSQIINWTAISGAAGYEYVINTSSGAPSGAGTPITATTYTASSLSSGTTYYAHVRTNCGGGSYSSWTTIPFTTSGPAAITGTPALCPGSTTHLSDAVGGGTWSSGNTTVATVAGGVVGGAGTGTAVITYSEGGCSAVVTVTVGTMPAITGSTSVCPGSTTSLTDAVPGGTWSSSTGSVATVTLTGGVVSGVTNGNTVITYSANGCSTTTTVTVAPLPPITGGNSLCVGNTLNLNDATGGGTWSSSNNPVATVSSSGVVTGVAPGTTTIIYTLNGCTSSETVTVGAAISPIVGTTTFCYTSSTTLSDNTAGGTWSSSNTSVATIATSGATVHGVIAGTDIISYSLGGCSVTATVTLDPTSAGTISGSTSVCLGHTITLSDNVPGGTWSSSITTRASIDPTGVVTGSAVGSVTIKYVVSNTCGTYTTSYVVTVVASGSACTTGVTATGTEASDLKVFPNPNGGQFVMNLSSDFDEEVNVLVTNLLGQKIKEFKTITNRDSNIKLDVPGIYILSAATSHGMYIAKVVVDK